MTQINSESQIGSAYHLFFGALRASLVAMHRPLQAATPQAHGARVPRALQVAKAEGSRDSAATLGIEWSAPATPLIMFCCVLFDCLGSSD